MSYAYNEFPHSKYAKIDYDQMFKLFLEMREKYNGILEEIEELKNRQSAYETNVDNRINTSVQSAMNVYKSTVSSEMNTRFSEMETRLNTKLNDMRSSLLKLISDKSAEMDTKYRTFTLTIEERVSDINSRLNRFTNKYDSMISILGNNFSVLEEDLLQFADILRTDMEQEIENLQKNLNTLGRESNKWLWNLIATTNTFSCLEWYNYPYVTCECWNESGITCEDWITRGRKIFKYDEYLQKEFSPITGEYETLSEIVKELVAGLKVNAITAGEYDAMKLTADEVERVRANVSEYDWAGDIYYKEFDSRTGKE